MCLAAGLMAVVGFVPGSGWCGANVSAASVDSAALIMTGTGRSARAVGAGFFVSVPSRRFAGKSFFYLVTVRHNLLDAHGHPLSELWLSVPHRATKVKERLPVANDWFFSQSNPKLDLAALPYSPPDATISAVAVGTMAAPGAGGISARALLGADAYYVSMIADAGASPVAALRFGWVSIAGPIPAGTAAAGIQHLLFVDGPGRPKMSGAPMFVDRNGTWLLGMVEADAAIEGEPGADHLVGVIPAAPIAELTRAMAAVQDRKREAGSR